jgi:hypothetical protein
MIDTAWIASRNSGKFEKVGTSHLKSYRRRSNCGTSKSLHHKPVSEIYGENCQVDRAANRVGSEFRIVDDDRSDRILSLASM